MVVSCCGDKIRICLDPGDLNKAVKREHYPILTVEEIVAKVKREHYPILTVEEIVAKILDANLVFHRPRCQKWISPNEVRL